jgi:hypothetical protein
MFHVLNQAVALQLRVRSVSKSVMLCLATNREGGKSK